MNCRCLFPTGRPLAHVHKARITASRGRSQPCARQTLGAARRPLSQVVFDTAFKAMQRDHIGNHRLRLLNQLENVSAGGESSTQQLGLAEDIREEASRFEYLRDEVAQRLVERLGDLDGSRIVSNACDVGCWGGHISQALSRRQAEQQLGHRDNANQFAAVDSLLQLDQSKAMLDLAKRQVDDTTSIASTFRELTDCAGGEENLELEDQSFDVVFSSMWLHWCNNLPGLLSQIRRSLRPDGLFLGAMLGGDTLSELRSSLVLAEQDVLGGVSARVSPLVHVGDVGMLLQGAGFSIPTVDTDLITVEYPSPRVMMKHIQGMGESNASALRQKAAIRRDVLDKAEEYYRSRYGNPEDGSVPATFQVIYMIGWAPSSDQPQPMARGTHDVSLADLKKELSSIPTIPSGPPPPPSA